MDYLSIRSRPGLDGGNVAAVWPRLEDAVAARSERFADEPPPVYTPTAAAPDVPPAVGRLIVGAYAALIGIFFALFARSPAATFSIVICAFFVATFFAVPRLFFAVEADRSRRPTLARFMTVGLDTLTGRSGGRDALVQMLIVPVLLGFGLAAIGIVGLVFLP